MSLCAVPPGAHKSLYFTESLPFLVETFQSSHAFPTIVPNSGAHLFTTFSARNVYSGPFLARPIFPVGFSRPEQDVLDVECVI